MTLNSVYNVVPQMDVIRKAVDLRVRIYRKILYSNKAEIKKIYIFTYTNQKLHVRFLWKWWFFFKCNQIYYRFSFLSSIYCISTFSSINLLLNTLSWQIHIDHVLYLLKKKYLTSILIKLRLYLTSNSLYQRYQPEQVL